MNDLHGITGTREEDCACETEELVDGSGGGTVTTIVVGQDACPVHQPRLVPPGLAIAVAKQHFTGRGAPCPWHAVDPLTRAMLIRTAHAFLADAIPALLEAGWTPPRTPPATPPG